MTAIAIGRREEIIASIADGKRLSDLDLGISPQAISKALRDDPEYQDAKETGLEVRLDRAEKMIENATLQVDVARASSLHRAVAWRAERECPHRWGQKTELRGSREAPLLIEQRETFVLELARAVAYTLSAVSYDAVPQLENSEENQGEDCIDSSVIR